MYGDQVNHQNQDQAKQAYTGRGLPVPANETRQAEIPHQLEKLERTLKGCMQGLDTLGARLEESVMRPEGASPIGNKAEPSAIQSTSIGSQLQNFVNVAAEINARIQSMAARLEV